MIETVAKACNCASLGLAFTAIGLFLMLLWASVQAVPASVESRPFQTSHQLRNFSDLTVSLPSTDHQLSSHHLEWDCSTALNKTLCEDELIHKRMKHPVKVHSNNDNRNSNEKKSPKNLHERQVRSFELNNKLTKNKVSHDKNTFVKYASVDISERQYDVIRNIQSLDDKVNEIMNNGETVSMESISETTHATFKESNVKTSAPKEASDKIYLHVNGE